MHLEAQISIVKKFTEDNFLKLNTSKCEIIIVFKKSCAREIRESSDIGDRSFPVRSEAVCLERDVDPRTQHLRCGM